MGSTRRNEIAAGVLFVIATPASLVGAALMPDLTRSGFLGEVADHQTRMALATLLSIVAAVCSVGIAVALYPVVRRSSAAVAMGSVVFRTIEGVFCLVGSVSNLSILTLARTSGAGTGTTQSIGDSLVAGHDRAAVVAVLAFCLGAGLYYLTFYRARLVPRWLSGWGLVGVVAMAAGAVLALLHDTEVTGYALLAMPIGVQEMVFALWLMIKGCARAPLAAGGTIPCPSRCRRPPSQLRPRGRRRRGPKSQPGESLTFGGRGSVPTWLPGRTTGATPPPSG